MMRYGKRNKWMRATVLLLVCIGLFSCNRAEKNPQPCPLEITGKVLYLHCSGLVVGKALDRLNTEYKIRHIIPNGTGYYGKDLGYWVIVD